MNFVNDLGFLESFFFGYMIEDQGDEQIDLNYIFKMLLIKELVRRSNVIEFFFLFCEYDVRGNLEMFYKVRRFVVDQYLQGYYQ